MLPPRERQNSGLAASAAKSYRAAEVAAVDRSTFNQSFPDDLLVVGASEVVRVCIGSVLCREMSSLRRPAIRR